ncbi:MAG: hypothetical protein P1P76_10845 [Anaerolineales bacterium]|nr:hypothetical protein [Anaerolineales bacterium]
MKKYLTIAGIPVAVAAIALVAVGTAVAADDDPPRPFPGAFGPGGCGVWGGGGNWDAFDTIADTFGMTPTELFEALHDGSTIEELAEAEDVDLEELQETLADLHKERARERIAEAVANGDLSQEQADWMLEGIEQGYGLAGRGFGRHGGRMFYPPAQ